MRTSSRGRPSSRRQTEPFLPAPISQDDVIDKGTAFWCIEVQSTSHGKETPQKMFYSAHRRVFTACFLNKTASHYRHEDKKGAHTAGGLLPRLLGRRREGPHGRCLHGFYVSCLPSAVITRRLRVRTSLGEHLAGSLVPPRRGRGLLQGPTEHVCSQGPFPSPLCGTISLPSSVFGEQIDHFQLHPVIV